MGELMVSAVDLPDEFAKRYTGWWPALARAVGFELAGSLTAGCSDPATERLVRTQHAQNAELLRRLMIPGMS